VGGRDLEIEGWGSEGAYLLLFEKKKNEKIIIDWDLHDSTHNYLPIHSIWLLRLRFRFVVY
jgi:hypothetical protein